MASRSLGLAPSLRSSHIIRSSTLAAARSFHVTQEAVTSIDVNESVRAVPKLSGAGPFAAETTMQVIGSSASLLSVSVPASAPLYTRRGTLVGMNGNLENTTSTLSLTQSQGPATPLHRLSLAQPFLYHKLTSTAPFSALISTKSQISSFSLLTLDGRVDWVVAKRDALLAWTGSALVVKPRANLRGGIGAWSQTLLTGRGQVALTAPGQIFQINLEAGESYLLSPSNLLAYSATSSSPSSPTPYRLQSSAQRMFNLQVPSLSGLVKIPESDFLSQVQTSTAFKTAAKLWTKARAWTRRTIYGDKQFQKFEGPATILVQSRARGFTDIISTRQVSEMAELTPGAAQSLEARFTTSATGKDELEESNRESERANYAGTLKVATVKDGRVVLEDTPNFEEFVPRR
ncbi:hypothetical protein SAICODRAFT_75258 [Saitoella complicata NRRL Y-17804]|uniref:Altered inheritance of mitochondria protein 24, mitochondrial n=1 Tax=Saitoella complicata (strain BCRC 22490 / CBS 7301 / JCM 7358 / NBRC 10748 / NRRL Y-17804) TaxID=698492 RepID=A0A0E9N971_SAICN|nr:uncharacterized protein SAICODRAFT_75258 [Saitoella complicata NRRL Y-17804]ODQ56607.1 hypothetical protein SAICODRAFT_75258 [Saitoella complicata NRRL Y-17804]GAO46422.1 hypothetical protein G7K_0653-t1 [Saitoella complicata NRRL Y-17804]